LTPHDFCCAWQIPDDVAYQSDGRHVQPDILVKTMLEVIVNTYAASSHSSGFALPAGWASGRRTLQKP